MQLRVSLTISGAVSLGAYEGGALAAVLVAARELAARREPLLRVDVMAGASAGSITSLLAARTLLQGHDPVQVMHGAWVESDSLGDLLAHGARSPLSVEALRAMGQSLLDPAEGRTSPQRQSQPVQLSYTLACLRGLEYALPRLGRDPVQASTYVDFFEHRLAPDDPITSLTEPAGSAPLDAALASAANAMGFAPQFLDRGQVWADYLAEGVRPDSLPSSHGFWYTDGGTLANEPLGRTLDLTNALDSEPPAGDWQRLHLLIHPHPAAAPKDDSWAQPGVPPSFVQTAVRAFALQRTQSVFGDLKTVEKTNSRLAWLDIVSREVGNAIEGLSPDAQRALRAALTRASGQMASGRDRLKAHLPDTSSAVTESSAGAATAAEQQPGLRELLDSVLHDAAGLSGKRPALVEVLSPLVLPAVKDHAVEEMLSGEVLFHFGGFLDKDMRESDFDLGYATVTAWIEQGGLRTAGLDDASSQTALSAVKAAHRPADGWTRTGSTTVGSLLRMHPWETAKLAGKITEVLLHDTWRHPRP
jgi:hypothetical protein